jgi:hypothetical protein
MSVIFKQSYSRGVADTLIRSGIAKFASVEQAQEVADYVGANVAFDPMQKVAAETTAAIAAHICELAEKIAGGGTSSLILGGVATQANTPENAAQYHALAALDQKNRPQGTYAKGEKGVGTTDFKAPAAAQIGVEQPHPLAPGTTDQKANSVNTFSKGASLNELIRKLASGDTGSLITGDKKEQENTPSNAATQAGGLAALDEKQRPQGTYAKGEEGVGNTELDTKPGAVGKEQPQPAAPGTTDQKSNSVNEQSKSAAYLARFEETAREYLPKLAKLSDDEKVAAVKALMGMEPGEATGYVATLGK